MFAMAMLWSHLPKDEEIRNRWAIHKEVSFSFKEQSHIICKMVDGAK